MDHTPQGAFRLGKRLPRGASLTSLPSGSSLMSQDSVLKRGSGRRSLLKEQQSHWPRWEGRRSGRDASDRQLRGRHWSCLLPRRWPRSHAGRPRLPVSPGTSHLRQELPCWPRFLCAAARPAGESPGPIQAFSSTCKTHPAFGHRIGGGEGLFVSVEMDPKESHSSAVFITSSSAFWKKNAVVADGSFWHTFVRVVFAVLR